MRSTQPMLRAILNARLRNIDKLAGDPIIKNSYKHCHAKGLHSILLHDTPGRRMRIFVADENHVLWKNKANRLMADSNQKMSVAFHQHHCDITLFPLSGGVYNHTLLNPGDFDQDKWHWYGFQSKISSANGGDFRKLPEQSAWFRAFLPSEVDIKTTVLDRELYLKASDFHTIAVESGETAAWLVIEGHDWPGYESVVLSNDDLTKFAWEKHYEPMDLITLTRCLEIIFKK